jgi:hypothetical protein
MTKIDLENLKKFFEKRAVDVSKNKTPQIKIQSSVLNKDEVFTILELFQEGKFYKFIEDIKRHSHDFKDIEIESN